MDERQIQFEGLSFPIFRVVDPAGPADEWFAGHYLTSEDGLKDLPFFRAEVDARTYIAHRKLVGLEPAPVSDARRMLILLEQFQSEGGTHVRFDAPYGPTTGTIAYPVGEFAEYVRAGIADAEGH